MLTNLERPILKNTKGVTNISRLESQKNLFELIDISVI